MKQFLIVSYDISDDKRRLKAMKTLQDHGTRVQYSVFECRLLDPQIEKLKKRLQPLVKEPQDSIRFYFLCAGDVGRTLVIRGQAGAGGATPEKTFIIQ